MFIKIITEKGKTILINTNQITYTSEVNEDGIMICFPDREEYIKLPNLSTSQFEKLLKPNFFKRIFGKIPEIKLQRETPRNEDDLLPFS